jgi:hypothetical protein
MGYYIDARIEGRPALLTLRRVGLEETKVPSGRSHYTAPTTSGPLGVFEKVTLKIVGSSDLSI